MTGESPILVGFSGYKHVGKTTLIAKLITHYTKKQVRVGAIKHDVHGFNGSPDQTDTATFAQSGAASIIVADTSGHYTLERFDQKPPSIDQCIGLLGQVDVVFIEGFKQEPFPKWVMLGEDLYSETAYREPDYLTDVMRMSEVLGYIVAKPPYAVVNQDLRVYDRNDIDAIVSVIDRLMFTK